MLKTLPSISFTLLLSLANAAQTFADTELSITNRSTPNDLTQRLEKPAFSLTSSSKTELSTPEFLPVEQAYRLNHEQSSEESIHLNWLISPNYFLYHHSVKVEAVTKQSTTDVTSDFSHSSALRKSDGYFGQVGVHYHRLELQQKNASEALSRADHIRVHYQGCADAGLCCGNFAKRN